MPMITMGDLLTKSKMRCTLFLDMAKGGYQNTYMSETYPRLHVVKSGQGGHHTTEYFVDGEPCADLEAVVMMLNTAPHPDREAMTRQQREAGED
jgi:hypothetical protein